MVVGPGESESVLPALSSVSRTGAAASLLPFPEPQPQPEELREAVGSNVAAVEPKDREGSSGCEEDPIGPGKRPSLGISR